MAAKSSNSKKTAAAKSIRLNVGERSTYPMKPSPKVFTEYDDQWLCCFGLVHVQNGVSWFALIDIMNGLICVVGGSVLLYRTDTVDHWVLGLVLLGIICMFSAITGCIGMRLASPVVLLGFMMIRAIMILYDLVIMVVVLFFAIQKNRDENTARTTTTFLVYPIRTTTKKEFSATSNLDSEMMFVFVGVLVFHVGLCIWFFVNAVLVHKFIKAKHEDLLLENSMRQL